MICKACVGVLVAAACASWCAGGAAAAEPADGVTLDLAQCIAMALGKHPRMARATARVDAARAAKAQARSAYLPRIDAEAKWQRLDEVPSVDAPIPQGMREAIIDSAALTAYAQTFGEIDSAYPGGGLPPTAPYQAIRQAVAAQAPTAIPIPLSGREVLTTSVTLRQPVFTGGKILHRNRQADAALGIAREQGTLSRHVVTFRVSAAYYGVVLGKELVEVANASRDRLRVIATITGNLYKVSRRVTEMGHLKAKIHLHKAQAAVAQAAKCRELALAQLREAIGLSAGTRLAVRDERLVARSQRNPTFEECLQDVLAIRPEVLQAHLGVRVRRSGVALARASYYPDVCLFVQFSHINDNEDFANPNDENQWVGGLAVSLPLFAGFSRPAKVREAKSRLREAEVTERDVRQTIALEVRAALLELTEKRERLKAAHEARDAAVARNKLARKGYRANTVSVEDMVEAQFDELEARAACLKAVYDHNVADACLDKVLCR